MLSPSLPRLCSDQDEVGLGTGAAGAVLQELLVALSQESGEMHSDGPLWSPQLRTDLGGLTVSSQLILTLQKVYYVPAAFTTEVEGVIPLYCKEGGEPFPYLAAGAVSLTDFIKAGPQPSTTVSSPGVEFMMVYSYASLDIFKRELFPFV